MRASLSIVLAAATISFTGCSIANTTCLTDTDCDQGQVCEAEVCSASCSGASDCANDEVCVARRDDEGRVCTLEIRVPQQDTPDDTMSTWVILVRDETPEDESQCNSDAPGTDLVGATLEDLLGTQSGIADLILVRPAGDANAFTSGSHLDGQTQLDGCSEERLSLGCGGWAALRFLGESGQPIVLDSLSSQIHVVERGATCEGDEDSAYAIYLCSAPNAVENNDDISSCTTLIGNATGEHVFVLDAVTM